MQLTSTTVYTLSVSESRIGTSLSIALLFVDHGDPFLHACLDYRRKDMDVVLDSFATRILIKSEVFVEQA
jgi:hypothetical protein